MARKLIVEGLEDLLGFVLGTVARQPGAVGLDQAKRRGIELVGAVEALTGFLLVARKIETGPERTTGYLREHGRARLQAATTELELKQVGGWPLAREAQKRGWVAMGQGAKALMRASEGGR